MDIRIDDLRGPEIRALLQEHLEHMRAISPPESVHALDLEALRQPEITFWTGWEGPQLVGCGAIKQLDALHAELKSMRTASAHVRQGVARALLMHIQDAARTKGFQTMSLETGSQPEFAPARTLYTKAGFVGCGPFGNYAPDPFSFFMTKAL